MTANLERVRRLTRRRTEADEAWRVAIATAVASGESLRDVAIAAGISHVGVLKITRAAMLESQ